MTRRTSTFSKYSTKTSWPPNQAGEEDQESTGRTTPGSRSKIQLINQDNPTVHGKGNNEVKTDPTYTRPKCPNAHIRPTPSRLTQRKRKCMYCCVSYRPAVLGQQWASRCPVRPDNVNQLNGSLEMNRSEILSFPPSSTAAVRPCTPPGRPSPNPASLPLCCRTGGGIGGRIGVWIRNYRSAGASMTTA